MEVKVQELSKVGSSPVLCAGCGESVPPKHKRHINREDPIYQDLVVFSCGRSSCKKRINKEIDKFRKENFREYASKKAWRAQGWVPREVDEEMEKNMPKVGEFTINT